MATFAGHWGPEEFLDRSMRPRPDADVYVYAVATTTPITLYANRLKSATITNPLPKGVGDSTAGLDAKGNGDFYAEPGEYRMVVKLAGTTVFDDIVTVANDQADGGGTGTAIYTDVSAAPYSATGANATTDRAAIQAAIDAVIATGGGTVFLPRIYDVDAPIILKSNVRLLGHGPAVSGLRRTASANFGTDGVLASPGSLTTRIENYRVEHLSIDGNYGMFGQTPAGGVNGSRGLNINGFSGHFENIWVRNCKDRGIHHTGGGSPGEALTNEFAGNFLVSMLRFVVSNCYGDAQMRWEGPTDCLFDEFWIYQRDYTNPPANEGLRVVNGGHTVQGGHIWGEAMKVGIYDAATGNMTYEDMKVESCSGNPLGAGLTGSANVVLEGGEKTFEGLIYDNTADHTNKTGVRIGTSGGASAQQVRVQVIVVNCLRGAIDYANAGGTCMVDAVVGPDAATMYVGSSTGDYRFLRFSSGNVTGEIQHIGKTRLTSGSALTPNLELVRNPFGATFPDAYLLGAVPAGGGLVLAGISNAGSLDLHERDATPGPISDMARISTRANGGITELVARCDTGDEFIIATQAGGPVLKAPDSSLWRLVVSNAGVLSTVAYP